MTALLASVNNPAEARIALDAGVDVIDLKNPTAGALGAVADPVAREIVAQVAGRVPVSATIGDLPLAHAGVVRAVRNKAATGVDYVKVGLFGEGAAGALSALQPLAEDGVQLVAVLFADRGIDLTLLHALAKAGFTGAMVDTAGKHAGCLRRHADQELLRGFVDLCREMGLLSGLAGSLDITDIAPLLELTPDLLGFRGALCRRGQRTDVLDWQAIAAVRKRIPLEDGTAPPAISTRNGDGLLRHSRTAR
ncbi:MAG: (5-formylfuran-3-yl)methyl phosphate synthase [Gammaproteobacteria bacterium]